MVVAGEGSRLDPESLDLRNSDREVLEFLRGQADVAVGFQGLRRRLGIHQEKLSRALHRLQRDDLVEKTDLGYRVSHRALSILSPTSLRPAGQRIPLLRTFLPPDLNLRDLATTMRGSWFGPIHWYGLTESPDEIVLSWISEDGSYELDARLRTGALSIEGHVDDPSLRPEALLAAHELFRRLSATYRLSLQG